VVVVRKALRFYLVASTMMSSVAFAGKEEHLEDLDKESLKIVLKTVAHKYDISWANEFDILDPSADEKATKVRHYIDRALSEKMENYNTRMYALPGVRQHPEFESLGSKYQKAYDKQNELSSSHSDWFMKAHEAQATLKESQAGALIGVGRSFSRDQRWDQEHRVDELDEKALKVAIQVLTNKKNKDAIYAEQLDLHDLEDQIRKENIEKLFELFSKNKGASSYEKSRRKISAQIDSVRKELSYLPQQLLEIENRVRGAQIERQVTLEDFQQRRQNLLKKVAAEQYLNELNLLDDIFLRQIRKDHADSMRHDKGDIPAGASLDMAMGMYAESVMSITKVMKENGYVKDLIERVLNSFQGDDAVTFQEASKKISEKAIDSGFHQIGQHLAGDHSSFPHFEKFTRMYYQLFDSDPTSLVHSQQNACKNGLYGRTVFYTFLALKEQLAQGIRNPSQLPAALSGGNAGFKEALLKLQSEEDADERAFLDFCYKAEIEKESLQKSIFVKEKALKNLVDEMAELSLSSSFVSPEFEVTPRTFRTTGANLSASNKHSAIRIDLSNQELRDAAYQLIVNYRTSEKGPSVRIFNPKGGEYIGLGFLPVSLEFNDAVFDLSPWVEAVRDEPLAKSVISTYLSFVGGMSDIHYFKIQSVGGILKEVVFGDRSSESQLGIHVYAPETDGDANEWSEAKEDVGPQ
jgi:hypothetical protein